LLLVVVALGRDVAADAGQLRLWLRVVIFLALILMI